MQPKTLECQCPSSFFHTQDHPFPARRREMYDSKFGYNNHLLLVHYIILMQCETGDNRSLQSKNNCKEQDVMCLKLWRSYTCTAWLQNQTIVLFFLSHTTLSPAWWKLHLKHLHLQIACPWKSIPAQVVAVCSNHATLEDRQKSYTTLCSELPKAKRDSFHGCLWDTRSWMQPLWELTISQQGPSGRRHSSINAISHQKGGSGYGVAWARTPSYTLQGPKHYKAVEGGRENFLYLHPLDHTHHKDFLVERFQISHQKLLLLDGSVQRNPSIWMVLLVMLAALVPGHDPCSHWLVVCKWSLGRSTLSLWDGCISAMAISWWTDIPKAATHPWQCLLFPQKRWWRRVSDSWSCLPEPVWTPLWPWRCSEKNPVGSQPWRFTAVPWLGKL